MRKIHSTELETISGGLGACEQLKIKVESSYYQEVVRPAVIIGGSTLAGFVGSAATAIIMYGIEGFIVAIPSARDQDK